MSDRIHNKPILCLDFDGVIHRYSKGWSAGELYDPPTDGFFDWLIEAQDKFDIVVYSSRSKYPDMLDAMRGYMCYYAAAWAQTQEHVSHQQMYCMLMTIEFVQEKPSAYITIDDRALTFTGKWSDFHPEELLAFKPWNYKET